MKSFVLSLLLVLFFAPHSRAQGQDVLVKFITSKGDITVVLYKETPLHQEMFLKAIESGVYQDAEFNRVIKGFVSQGGELDEAILAEEAKHPDVKPKRLPGEFPARGLHKKGAFGAGRDDNPEKSSYFNQIYFVTGRVMSANQLDALEQRTGKKWTTEARQVYQTIGGEPRLDGDYTIFGEILEGLDVLEKINAVATGDGDVPVERVSFKVIKL